MKTKTKNKSKMLAALLIAVLLAIAFIGAMFAAQTPMTQASAQINESLNGKWNPFYESWGKSDNHEWLHDINNRRNKIKMQLINNSSCYHIIDLNDMSVTNSRPDNECGCCVSINPYNYSITIEAWCLVSQGGWATNVYFSFYSGKPYIQRITSNSNSADIHIIRLYEWVVLPSWVFVHQLNCYTETWTASSPQERIKVRGMGDEIILYPGWDGWIGGDYIVLFCGLTLTVMPWNHSGFSARIYQWM